MRRVRLSGLLLIALGTLWLLRYEPTRLPEAYAQVVNPYRGPHLRDYATLFDAAARSDDPRLERFAETAPPSFLHYRTLLGIARDPQVEPEKRLAYFERALSYGLTSPLERGKTRRERLELGKLAERASKRAKALEAYEAALPLQEAVRGIRRLEPDARQRAARLLRGGVPEAALSELAGVRAPALRAGALAASGDYEAALQSYTLWHTQHPGNKKAEDGVFRMLMALGRSDEAAAFLSTIEGTPAQRATVAEAQGDIAGAVAAYREDGSAASLWQGAALLEQAGQVGDALAFYLELAEGAGDLQDDAAYRAYLLAEREGLIAHALIAHSLVPAFSFFGQLLGKALPDATASLAEKHLPALRRAAALVAAGDPEAALGELHVALKRAQDEATTVALAKAMQDLGDYAVSSQAARDFVEAGSLSRRTWRVAYPQAFAGVVRQNAAAYGVPETLIWGVMRQESHFYPHALSTSDAAGLMQIVPDTWDWLAELLAETPGSAFETERNIRYGVYYLSRLMNSFDASSAVVAAAYNGGPGYVSRLLDGAPRVTPEDFYRLISRAETREYVQRVMLNEAVYRALYLD